MSVSAGDRAGPRGKPGGRGEPGTRGEHAELDLRGVPCPLNWVRTKLALEAMGVGGELAVRLDPGEPHESVPRSAREDGHHVELDGELVRIVRR